MGKLSIEEKAKRYEEAIEIARKRWKNPNYAFADKVIVEMFPELKESEDERIRKRIYNYINVTLDDNESEEKEKWLAWLERQGEHSVSPLFTFEDVLAIQCAMAYAKFQDRELDVALKKLHDKVYDAYHDSKNHHIESQDGLKGEQILANSAKTCNDEQKPTDKVEHKRMTKLEDKLSSLVVNAVHIYCKENELDTPHYVGLILGDRLAKEWSQDILTLAKDELKMTEQNLAWSEDDEMILSDIIKDLVHPWNEYIPDRIENEIKWLKNRLKSLKDRIQPQNTWKPSDEQIEALDFAADCIVPAEFCVKRKVLKELLEQLKKLRKG